jgi:hypothetical protein
MGPSWSWPHGSWIYNYLCNQCVALLKFFQQYFHYIVTVSFIVAGNRRIWWKPPTCRKSLTNIFTYCCIEFHVLLEFYHSHHILLLLDIYICYFQLQKWQSHCLHPHQPKEKVQKDIQRSTKHTHKTKDRATRTPLKTRGELRCSGRVSSSCSIKLWTV